MTHEIVQDYYGKTLQGSDDLQTDACCTPQALPPRVRAALAKIHPEVAGRYYGCGLVMPDLLEGTRILDLGSGSGRDVYALAQLAGPEGSVVGIDMTPEQLAVAEAHRGWHAERFGYDNTAFHEGLIERLDDLPLEPESFDVIVSNCVVNLAMDKAAVLGGAHRLLKPGGEMYFSDVYAERRVPDGLRSDPVLYGECLAGALYWNDFLGLAREAGFADPRVVESRPLAVTNPELAAKLGPVTFRSVTCRLFRLELDPFREDYGQAALYHGTIPEAPAALVLDEDHVFETGRAVAVDGNTARMLSGTRFAPHVTILGDGRTHFGPFGAPRPAPAATSSCCP